MSDAPKPEGISPESPEARRRGFGTRIRHTLGWLGLRDKFFVVVKRVAVGTFNEGFTYAGNLAYLSLVTLFPFFIVAAAFARLIGRTGEGLHTLEAFLRTVPPDVATVLRQPVHDVLDPRLLSEWILADHLPVRLKLQLHKFIWSPTTRGG